ncbi:hypothetical protein [Nostoc sp. DedSLP04]|uniref:hypothetical protein n=1 Tax=Nostoc sp. DedSLP04 TaxID=3075401 RepID=UPI002AD20384|nr:hypothetical protein [Nostoc sp. DedSLP04]MDZ8030958.1 hypothetical protein [Nostoc sp. DedSLP04]
MSKELIKQKLIEHLKLYGFEYSWFEDETGNRVNFVDEDGTLSFDIPVKFYLIDNNKINSISDYELHIQNSRIGGGGIRIVVYWTGIEREFTDEFIVCVENIDFIQEIPFAINKVLCSLASLNFKVEWHDRMIDVENYINYIAKSKNTNIDSRNTDFIKDKIKHFINSPYK